MIVTDSILKALATIDSDINHSDLWLLSDPDIVFHSSSDDNYSHFFEHANACIKKRSDAKTGLPFAGEKDGRWLLFFPNNALFEDVTIETTHGFFGSGDCPPPAFWTHVDGDILVSFIPHAFVKVASAGVNICVNETLKWHEPKGWLARTLQSNRWRFSHKAKP